jgi:hypothetical protein
MLIGEISEEDCGLTQNISWKWVVRLRGKWGLSGHSPGNDPPWPIFGLLAFIKDEGRLEAL